MEVGVVGGSDTAPEMGGALRTGGGAPLRSPAEAPSAARLLDRYDNNRTQPKWEPLPDAPLEVHPEYSRSALDRNGGRRARWRTCQRTFDAIMRGIEVAAVQGMRPYCLHLTIDRDQWTKGRGFHELDGARHAHRYLTDHIRHVMRRCGVTHWLRVLEFQSKTGCGWSHWHCVAFFPASMSPDEVRLLVHRRWLGVQGGRIARIHPAQKRHGKWDLLAGYFAKYVSKGADAVPPWLDHPDIYALKTYTMSRSLGVLVRDRPRRPAALLGRRRGARTLQPLFLRLARSGSMVTVRRQCVNTETGEVRPFALGKPFVLPPESRIRAHEDGVLSECRYPHLPRRDRYGLLSTVVDVGRLDVWLSWFQDVIEADALRYESVQREAMREWWYEHQRGLAAAPRAERSEAARTDAARESLRDRSGDAERSEERHEGGAAPPRSGTRADA